MNAARVTALPERERVQQPATPHCTVVIGSRWSAKHLIEHDREGGRYAERNPEMTRDGARLQAALLAKPAKSWRDAVRAWWRP